MSPGRFGGSLAVWLLLVAYATLYPFWPMRPPGADAFAGLLQFPRYVTRSDIAFNVAAYVPLGTLATLYFLRLGHAPRAAILRSVALAAGYSAALEFFQAFIPNRVSSLLDVAANTLGGAVGALAFAPPFHAWLTRPLALARERFVIGGAWGDAGLVLLMLWLLAQTNPGLPFFGAGNIADGSPGLDGPRRALEWLAVAVGLAGFGLFLSALLREDVGALRSTLVLLSVALWLKFSTASLMLVPHVVDDWMGEGRVAGLAGGLALLVPLRRLPRAARTYVAVLLILAAGLLTKIFGEYAGVEEFLRLFRWPHGQLASFATLTRYLHELWPVGAVVFLAGLFAAGRRRAHEIISP